MPTEPLSLREARAAYTAARLTERKRIALRLQEAGYKAQPAYRAGQGRPTYRNHGALPTPHDLSNWMWIDAEHRTGVVVRVMLQTFDQDSLTGNEHVLYDRVGIGVMPRKIEHSRWFDDTGLELPLDDAELEQLIARVDSLVAALLEAPAAAQ